VGNYVHERMDDHASRRGRSGSCPLSNRDVEFETKARVRRAQIVEKNDHAQRVKTARAEPMGKGDGFRPGVAESKIVPAG